MAVVLPVFDANPPTPTFFRVMPRTLPQRRIGLQCYYPATICQSSSNARADRPRRAEKLMRPTEDLIEEIARALERCGGVSTLIEWDDEIPSFEEVYAEAEKAIAVRERVLGRTGSKTLSNAAVTP